MNKPLQLSFDARPTHTIPRHRPVRPLGIEFLEARTMLTTLTGFEAPVVPLSSAQSESLSEVRADALYVWRYPPANGTPVDYAEAQRVANFAGANGISTIYYDNWGCGL